MKEHIISASEVSNRIGVSRVTLWRWENAGEFPLRIKIGPNRVGWRVSEIEDWVSSRPTVRNAEISGGNDD